MLRRYIADERVAHEMAINNIRGLLESESKRGKSGQHVDHFIFRVL
jgi:hypothetical protein